METVDLYTSLESAPDDLLEAVIQLLDFTTLYLSSL
jgi:hypothetical protein